MSDLGALKVIVDSVVQKVARGPRGYPGKDGMAPGDLKFGVWLTMPEGYLFCDGGLYLKSEYPALYAAIGDQFTPAGTDPLYFGVPDWREREVRGSTSMAMDIGVVNGNDGLALGSRAAAHDHAHSHSSSASVSGGVTSSGAGTSLTGGIFGADTNHNHTGPPDHSTQTNTATGGSATRVHTPGHGSTSLAVQPGGISHAHGHNMGISDPGHSHGHNIAVTPTVTPTGSYEHPQQYCHVLIKT